MTTNAKPTLSRETMRRIGADMRSYYKVTMTEPSADITLAMLKLQAKEGFDKK